ncbi:MAG TPA: cytochrome c [Kofleriaceae bacterium]|nr:cytochrome c [Kofleriaceae bacterium]
MLPVPVPRDIPLPLPADGFYLEPLLIVAFIAHILFVNLTVGGAVYVFLLQLWSRRRPDYAVLARAVAQTLTVNKSMAVVLGVAPLLLINVLYTVHFYTANALTGMAWIALVPVIAGAFVLLYVHKYTWVRLAHRPRLHLAIAGVAVALLLFVPLVFLANVSLMMMPERWSSVAGLWDAVWLPAVLPRYFHFMSASLILTSLFGVGYFGREKFVQQAGFETLTAPNIRRFFYRIAFGTSLGQYVIGPTILLTLPADGLNTAVLATVLIGAVISLAPISMMWLELKEPLAHRTRLLEISVLLTATVLCMAMGRHAYRKIRLAPHQRAIANATEQWNSDSSQAAFNARLRSELEASGRSVGQPIFEANCMACHARDERLIGPPLTEIANIYAGNPDGIVTWAMAPGKKREGFPQMPPFEVLGKEKLRHVADYILQTAAHK